MRETIERSHSSSERNMPFLSAVQSTMRERRKEKKTDKKEKKTDTR
jgi:hypothetical protein